MKRVVVVGGGIAGLATALHLRDRSRGVPDGLEVVLLESGDRIGGNIRTDREDGWIVEWGPNGYLDNAPATPALVNRLGLSDRVRRARTGKRYLFRHGRLHRLPSGPASLLASPILSVPGRLRVFWEPFVMSRRNGWDETVAEFASRRIGQEAADVLVDAMVCGVFAGNSKELSLRSSFPKMAAMEAEHGSLVRAMIASERKRRAAIRRAKVEGTEIEHLRQPRAAGAAGPGGTLTTFDQGLQVLPDALASELGPTIHLNTGVAMIEPVAADGLGTTHRRWTVVLADGAHLEADSVVLTAPAARVAPWVGHWSDTLATTLHEIPSAPLAVIALGYSARDIGGAPDGSGFLVPRCDRPRILGCLWDSSLFPGRAPEGKVLLRVMIGGAHDPDAVTLDDDELTDLVLRDLATTMGVSAEPVLRRVYRHHTGIAQYTRGHQTRLDRIDACLRQFPGLSVAGSSYRGGSMNACITEAREHGDRIIRELGAR